MTPVDWSVIGVYILFVVGLGFYYNQFQTDIGQYYLADRGITWWQSGLSTMATQLSAISFVSAPAFVALKDDGGLKILTWEFGVPIGILVVIVGILPVIHRNDYLSIYEYLEERFDRQVRAMTSFLFLVARGLSTGVVVLTGGLFLSATLKLPTVESILIIGGITVVYDYMGGIRVVVLSDVFQMLIIFVGIVSCGVVAYGEVGLFDAVYSFEPSRLKILDFGDAGLSSGNNYAFWPTLIGGMFLYISYYGCDQSQVQRELSVGDEDEVRRSLILNAVGRFPLFLTYAFVGILVGAMFTYPETYRTVAESTGTTVGSVREILRQQPDRMLPLFIVTYLPRGLVGLLFAGIVSALMSSLDSALNSLSASTMRDFYQPYVRPNADRKHYLTVSRILTIGWGVFCVGFAIVFASQPESTRQTTLLLVNAIGSLIYGPIAAAFLLGLMTPWARANPLKVGLVSGIIINLLIWQFTPVAWFWWNLTGFMAVVLTVLMLSDLKFTSEGRVLLHLPESPSKMELPRLYRFLFIYFGFIVMACWLLERALT